MRRKVWAFLPWVLLSACGGGGGGGGGGAIPLQGLEARITDALCGFEVRCGAFSDLVSCKQSTHANLAQIMADVNAGKTRYDGNAAAACVDTVASLTCNLAEQFNLITQACDNTFKGTVVAGGACFGDEECTSLHCDRMACQTTTTCCAGTCHPDDVRVAAGGDCLPPGTICADGTFCQAAAGGRSAVCHARLAAGQPCESFSGCASGLFCQQTMAGAAGICVRYPATGEACDPIGSLPCAWTTDTCDPDTSKCVPRTAIGGACTSGQECVGYASCDPGTTKCVSRKGVGGACADQPDCFASLTCLNGACAENPPAPVCP